MIYEIATHLAATVPDDILGSFSNDDGEGNANGKKAKSLIRKNNTSARDTFLYISFPSLHDYDLKMPNFYALCYVQTDATLLDNIYHHCWMSHVASVCKPVACCCLFFFWQNKAMFLLNIEGCFATRDVCASAKRP